LRQGRSLHHDVPVEQQVIVVQDAIYLFAPHVFAVQAGQIRLPLAAPRELLLDGLLQR
jgi:hypothetical protein